MLTGECSLRTLSCGVDLILPMCLLEDKLDDKKYYVYIWIRNDNGEVFYVGKGHGNRYKDRSMRNRYFNNVVNKVGIENIHIKIIEDGLTESEAFKREVYYIQYYKERGDRLTNMTLGGKGSSNWYDHLSEFEKEEHRNRSKSFLGKRHTEEAKQKMSASSKGKKHNMTQEGRQRLSESVKSRPAPFLGKHLSDEAKEKLRKAHIGTKSKNAKAVYVLDTKRHILDEIRSRGETFDKYSEIKQHSIRKSLKHNSNIEILDDCLMCDEVTFIYKQDYLRINSQSTIETTA